MNVRLALAAAIVASVLLSPAILFADNPVSAPISDLGVEFDVRPWVQIPDSSLGRPRLNSTATWGDRFFVVEDYDGDIWEIVVTDGVPEARHFFDVKAAIAAATPRELDNTNLFHGGLRDIAFHPDFDVNGRLYTTVMESRPASPNPADYLSDAVTPIAADSVLIEWTVDTQTGEVDPMSYRQVFRVGMPVYDHPIKQMAFNPFVEPGDDDYGQLYIAHGDGSVTSAVAGGGLNNDALGKILRIDPLQDGAAPYRVSADNPFIGDPTMLDEVWSLGHRNPHHLAFARHGDSVVLIAAEPGRDNIEEVNLITGGANYGWGDREGTFVHLAAGGLLDGIGPLPSDEAQNGYTFPAAQVGHEGARGAQFLGQAIAGGYVVANGSELSGQYFYSDFARSGRVFHSSLDALTDAVTLLDPLSPGRDHPDDLTQAPTGEVSLIFDHDRDEGTQSIVRTDMNDIVDDAPTYDGSGRTDVRFGQGPEGELYILNKRNGWVYLVTNSLPPQKSCNGLPATTTGLIGTPGDDVIVGTAGDDVIDGGAGNDTICGLAGNDLVRGGDGADALFGGAGNDRLFGGSSADLIDGGDGRDVIRGEGGSDTLLGGKRNDRISGNAGRDEIRGGNGRDRLSGQSGADVIFGGGGNDTISGGSGVDAGNGGVGNDRCLSVFEPVNCES